MKGVIPKFSLYYCIIKIIIFLKTLYSKKKKTCNITDLHFWLEIKIARHFLPGLGMNAIEKHDFKTLISGIFHFWRVCGFDCLL